MLIIFSVSFVDFGVYKCIVYNIVGMFIRIFNVNIEGKDVCFNVYFL